MSSDEYEEQLTAFMTRIDIENIKRFKLGLSIIRPHEVRECFRVMVELGFEINIKK